MNLERVIPEILKQNEEIELFNNDGVLAIAQMILCEAQELVEATENAFLTDDLTAVALECADVAYLLIRLFNELGIDERAVDIKVKRNTEKYSGFTNKDVAKEAWKKRGGDKVWLEQYIDKFDE